MSNSGFSQVGLVLYVSKVAWRNTNAKNQIKALLQNALNLLSPYSFYLRTPLPLHPHFRTKSAFKTKLTGEPQSLVYPKNTWPADSEF
jgi:hypothetical protein